MSQPCSAHGATPSVVVCSACGIRMCDVCFRFEELGNALCVRCAYELSTRAQRRISLAVFMALGSVAGLVWGNSQLRFQIEPFQVWLAAGLGLCVSAYLARAGFRGLAEDRVKARSPLTITDDKIAPSRGARRAALARRVVQAASPKLSGRATAAVVLLALVGACLTFPVAMHAPRWLEVEAVLAATWCILMLTISLLLFRGFRLQDDLFFYKPTLELKRRHDRGSLQLDGCDLGDPGCIDAAGCDEGGALLKRAAHDRHDCRGRLGRALAWGTAWASLYVAPLALLVYALHRATVP